MRRLCRAHSQGRPARRSAGIGLTGEQVDDLTNPRLRQGIEVKPSDSRTNARPFERQGQVAASLAARRRGMAVDRAVARFGRPDHRSVLRQRGMGAHLWRDGPELDRQR